MIVAQYKIEGFLRVMVRRVKNEMVSVVYVDFGTLDKVRLKVIRLLCKRFGNCQPMPLQPGCEESRRLRDGGSGQEEAGGAGH